MARSVRPGGREIGQSKQSAELSGAGGRSRWARVAAGVAGLALLAGLGACSPTPTPISSTYGSSTYGSSTYGSSTYGSSTYGSSTYGSSTSGSSAAGSYGSSSSSTYSDSSSSGSSSGSGYGGSYTNSDGQQVERPDGNSSGATAICKDGTDSHSKHKSGTCSGHGGVREWL
ncbi:MAG TPA: DUF3761 domain-containing protein [Actinomycetospora sp.]|uniref:DUF3761 domain-containing protein n=1 Tax=Actinomycetospora sp. TaxID=1872135 RepID=UPI002F3EC1BC